MRLEKKQQKVRPPNTIVPSACTTASTKVDIGLKISITFDSKLPVISCYSLGTTNVTGLTISI